MSFAFNAAPFNNNNEEITSNSSSIDRKRNAKNKTRKFRRENTSAVQNLKDHINGNDYTGIDNDDEGLANFHPPPKPESVGVNRTKERSDNDPRESLIHDVPVQPMGNNMFNSGGDAPVGQEAFQNLPSLAAEDYYKQFVPYYDRTNTGTISNDELTEIRL